MGIPEPLRKDIITALRSGEYKGTLRFVLRRTLLKGDFYCASGVVCDVASKHLSDAARWFQESATEWTFGYSAGRRSNIPPYSFCESLGVDKSWFRVIATLNDTADCSFTEIADVLEHFTDEEMVGISFYDQIQWKTIDEGKWERWKT